jgi:copper chaperone NosL
MIRFIKTGVVKQKDISRTVVVNYEKQDDFIDTDKAFFLVSDSTKSPMGFNISAFSNKESLFKFGEKFFSWNELYNKIE